MSGAGQLDSIVDSEKRKQGGCGAVMLGSHDPVWGHRENSPKREDQ